MSAFDHRRQMAPARLEILEADHRALEVLFVGHQETLLGFEFSSALAKLEEFSRRLRQHFHLEEEELLPACKTLKELPRSADPRHFLEEHRKIEDLLESILRTVRGLSAGTGTRRSVLNLLDRELRFKSLLDHHMRREEKVLLPVMRDRTAAEGA